MMIIELLCKHY